jgi:hypothetical protein
MHLTRYLLRDGDSFNFFPSKSCRLDCIDVVDIAKQSLIFIFFNQQISYYFGLFLLILVLDYLSFSLVLVLVYFYFLFLFLLLLLFLVVTLSKYDFIY